MARTTPLTEVAEWLDSLDPSTMPVRDGRYLRAISTARKSVVEAEGALQAAVDQARAAGDSWTVIGMALGTSKQNAHRKFGRGPGPPASQG